MLIVPPYLPAAGRYSGVSYVAPLSLEFWHSYGGTRALDTQRAIVALLT